MLLIISGVIFMLSLIGIGILASKHRSELEHATVPEKVMTVYEEVKARVLEDRLRRKLLSLFGGVWKLVRPVLVAIKNTTRKLYHRLLERERHYREESERIEFSEKKHHEKKEVIESKLEEVHEEETDEDLERKYLEVLALEPKNKEAYEGLGKLYVKQKDFEHAQEIFSYLVKLGSKKIDHYLQLAESSFQLERFDKSLETLKEALKHEPKNPKIIDRIIQIAILVEDKVLAKEYINQLKQSNPDNKKIHEYRSALRKLR